MKKNFYFVMLNLFFLYSCHNENKSSTESSKANLDTTNPTKKSTLTAINTKYGPLNNCHGAADIISTKESLDYIDSFKKHFPDNFHTKHLPFDTNVFLFMANHLTGFDGVKMFLIKKASKLNILFTPASGKNEDPTWTAWTGKEADYPRGKMIIPDSSSIKYIVAFQNQFPDSMHTKSVYYDACVIKFVADYLRKNPRHDDGIQLYFIQYKGRPIDVPTSVDNQISILFVPTIKGKEDWDAWNETNMMVTKDILGSMNHGDLCPPNYCTTIK